LAVVCGIAGAHGLPAAVEVEHGAAPVDDKPIVGVGAANANPNRAFKCLKRPANIAAIGQSKRRAKILLAC
tara:strand:- start:187 stop:399 length:213 start_codon:yes stop_codon:yes gene_type:complete